MRPHIGTSVLALGLIVGAAYPLLAHHSVTGSYDTKKFFTIKGTVTRIEWINPHVFVHVTAKDAKGALVTWQLETVPVGFMRRAGITREMVMGKPGEVVTVTANPPFDGSKLTGILSRIKYEDGHEYKLGIDGTQETDAQ